MLYVDNGTDFTSTHLEQACHNLKTRIMHSPPAKPQGRGKVERGVRFLKNALFFADSLFLKKPSRIMALLMVMGLSLLVYALAQHQIRQQLAERDETLPDQTGKPTQRSTARRVFQMMEGIDVLIIEQRGVQQRLILNLINLRKRYDLLE